MKPKTQILLCFDIPREKSSLRVKIWRDLNEAGAKKRTGSIWSLSYSRINLNEFKRIAQQINSKGGKAEIFLANVIRITKISEKKTSDVIRITNSINDLIKSSVIILDKPSNLTSSQATQEIRKIFNSKKSGNSGILDPRATGVLLIALDKALKAMPVLMGLDKEYEGIMHLHKDVSLKTLRETIRKSFIGEIIQVPPVKSRVARKPRKRKVYYFKILKKEGRDVKFKVKVQAGTYIRKICHDLGEELGVGAHLKQLRRLSIAHFKLKDAHTLEEIKKAYEEFKKGNEEKLRKILIPIEKAIKHVKKVYVKRESVNFIRNGAPVLSSSLTRIQPGIKPNETVAIFSGKELIAFGIAKVSSEEMLKRKGSVIRTDRVM